MGNPVMVGAFELQHVLTGTIALKPLVSNGRAGDVPTKVFELMTLVDGEPHVSMRTQSSAR